MALNARASLLVASCLAVGACSHARKQMQDDKAHVLGHQNNNAPNPALPGSLAV
jgi:hypothetical protein